MPRDQPVRWDSTETIEVLNFLNNNFDAWHKNHLSACVESIEATCTTRDARSIYNKVHIMIKAMDEFLNTGKKSTNCTVIWEDNTIHELVRQLYKKTKERREKENLETISDNDMMNIDDESTELFSTELVDNLFKEKIQEITQNRYKLIETVENTNSTFRKSNIPSPYSIETVKNTCSEKSKQIKQLQTELIKTIEIANNLYEKLKNFQ
ncbi:hypothetical protein C1645_738594 [Glomus cerebriforme]|uniref:Uncharacterized protein n=1 Tax=Glomus cerebriforme TaxID=658196 RepID=A0A397T2Z5_9GLOM|nr:hypothetical protein C1645_738594 [Glomus cerebriforme]